MGEEEQGLGRIGGEEEQGQKEEEKGLRRMRGEEEHGQKEEEKGLRRMWGEEEQGDTKSFAVLARRFLGPEVVSVTNQL